MSAMTYCYLFFHSFIHLFLLITSLTEKVDLLAGITVFTQEQMKFFARAEARKILLALA